MMGHPRVAEEIEMPFSQENQDWIHREIQDSIGKALKGIARPSGFRKALFVLHEWGVLAVNATIIVTLFILALTQYNAANKRLVDEGRFEENTGGRLKTIESELTSLRALTASSNPTRKANQDAARELLAQARQNLVPPISEAVVEQAGGSFLGAAPTDSSAWKVALDFVAYRSSLNTPKFPSGPSLPEAEVVTHYDSNPIPTDKPSPKMMRWYGPLVRPEQAARWDHIGVDQNKNVPVQPTLLSASGGAISLDGMHIKNVILQRGWPDRSWKLSGGSA